MKAEIIAIGDELLSGYVLNTNMQHIAKGLLKEGCQVIKGMIVRDSVSDIKAAIKEAENRCQIIIATGGLGPTIDDVTREAACSLFDDTLQYLPEFEEALIQRFGPVNPTIQNQCHQPSNAKAIMNPVGSAPALVYERGDKLIVFLPGPPPEMIPLFDNDILPIIRNRIALKEKWIVRFLYFTNMRESDIDPSLRSLKAMHSGIEFGIYPAPALITVTLKGLVESDILKAYETLKIQFPKNIELDNGSLSLTCKNVLTKRGLKLAAAESLSGGHLGSLLTKTPGSSAYFLGSIVAYSNALKTDILKIPEELIQHKGAVSEEVALLMAKNVRSLTKADIGISLTGIAGPTGATPEKPVGTYFACIVEGEKIHCWKGLAKGSREMVIEWAVNDIISSLCRMVRGYDDRL